MKSKLLIILMFSFVFYTNAQWTPQATGFTNQFTGVEDISIVDQNIVWALGFDGSGNDNNYQQFTRTTDGGNTWISGNINVGNPMLNINNISPVSATKAWIGAVDENDGLGGVWVTTDGGITWTQQNVTAYTNANSYFNVVHFFDENIGITQGDPINGTDFEMYRTTDGGTTWNPIPGSSLPNIVSGEYGYNSGNVSAGNSFWFVTNFGNIYRTTDTGLTWTKHSTPVSDFSGQNSFATLNFSDNNIGIILSIEFDIINGISFTTYTTNNGGTSWSSGTNYTQPYFTFSFIPGTNILVGTGEDDNGVYISGFSNDFGATWTEIDNGVERGEVKFLNATTGWASGFTNSSTNGGIFKYTGTNLSSESFLTSNFDIYPNPVNDLISISSNSISFDNISLSDINGRIVKSINFNTVSEYNLNVSELNAGIYFLKIKTAEGIVDKKIIKN